MCVVRVLHHSTTDQDVVPYTHRSAPSQEAQRVAKLQSIQADLQYALDEIDQGGFTDKTTLQVCCPSNVLLATCVF